MFILYRHPVGDNLSMTKSALHKSTNASILQVLSKISSLYHDATGRMHTGNFLELTLASVVLEIGKLIFNNYNQVIRSLSQTFISFCGRHELLNLSINMKELASSRWRGALLHNYRICTGNVWLQKISIPPQQRVIGNSEEGGSLKGQNF